jgi:hypothetical protein
MPEVGIDQIGSATHAMTFGGAAGKAAGGSFWTPDNITQIIKGIKDLMTEYSKVKSIVGGMASADVMDNSDMHTGRPPPAQHNAQTVTMPQIKDFGRRLCDQLEKQGYGDQTVLQVLQKLPFTVSQIKGMIT